MFYQNRSFPWQPGLGFISLIALVVFIVIVYRIISSLLEYLKNNNSELCQIKAKIISKRTELSSSPNTMAFSSYYIGFEEVDSLERQEFLVADKDYGLLAEGDLGILSYQGSRFISFTRIRDK